MTIVLSEGGISLMTTDELVKQSFASLKVGAFEIRPGNPRQARCAAAVVRTVGFPRPVACLLGLSSLTYFVQGWVGGTERFSQAHTFAIVKEVLSAGVDAAPAGRRLADTGFRARSAGQ